MKYSSYHAAIRALGIRPKTTDPYRDGKLEITELAPTLKRKHLHWPDKLFQRQISMCALAVKLLVEMDVPQRIAELVASQCVKVKKRFFGFHCTPLDPRTKPLIEHASRDLSNGKLVCDLTKSRQYFVLSIDLADETHLLETAFSIWLGAQKSALGFIYKNNYRRKPTDFFRDVLIVYLRQFGWKDAIDIDRQLIHMRLSPLGRTPKTNFKNHIRKVRHQLLNAVRYIERSPRYRYSTERIFTSISHSQSGK